MALPLPLPSSVLFRSDVGKERKKEGNTMEEKGKRNGVNKNFFGGDGDGIEA